MDNKSTPNILEVLEEKLEMAMKVILTHDYVKVMCWTKNV